MGVYKTLQDKTLAEAAFNHHMRLAVRRFVSEKLGLKRTSGFILRADAG